MTAFDGSIPLGCQQISC